MEPPLLVSHSTQRPMQVDFSWRRFSALRQRITGVLTTLLMINWAAFLSIYTFEVQYSCKPLVGASACSPCAEVDAPHSFWQDINIFVKEESLPTCPKQLRSTQSGDEINITGSGGKSTPDTSETNRADGGGSSNGDDFRPLIPPQKMIEGSLAGSVVAVGAVVAGAPAMIAIGVGVAVWLAASALLASNS
ncbi:hypothetical protein PN498_26620 [Oscillatoria sp. CS-180]|uniref:hypothetical protein n=1 Tax=Oscillatoria sp. CS-180 TaxID=3021720 RepID=UPI0023312584|nr:hypothetical protein [Oscillatoria sp. CS-180]MDB9529593.1 hypothetical protein [Oscillatoria sp. CS-180]